MNNTDPHPEWDHPERLNAFFFTENAVGPKGAKQISESLMVNTTLTELHLCSEYYSFLLECYVVFLFSFQFLFIKDNKIEAEGAKHLSEALMVNHSLTTLDLDSDKVIFNGIEGVKTLCSVNNIGDDGTASISESLKTNTTLTSLSLSSITQNSSYMCF